MAQHRNNQLDCRLRLLCQSCVINRLNEPVSVIKGIGEETSALLGELNIFTVNDLLEHFPYRYEDYRLRDLASVKHDERVTVEGKVHSEPSLLFYGRKKSRLTIRLLVDRYLIQVVFFNQPFLKKKFAINQLVTVTGKWDQHRQMITASEIHSGSHLKSKNLEPVYTVKGKLTVKGLRKFISLALNQYQGDIVETLPETIRNRYRLLNRVDALWALHFPENEEDAKQARRRFVYEEFLLFQLKMQALRKYEREQSQGVTVVFEQEKVDEFIKTLPFPLTNAQHRVVTEILADLSSPYRMNRLLQGDVGSGKTVVAAIGLFACVQAGFQGALMVPTEILAEQHAESLQGLLEPVGIKSRLLTSSVKGKRRREILEELAKGEIHVLIGTHALIQEEVQFQKLGFVITDEQHVRP